MRTHVGNETEPRELASDGLARDLRRNGSIIMSAFAFLWLVSVPGVGSFGARLTVLGVAVVATVATVALALRRHRSGNRGAPLYPPPDWQRRYNLIGLAEFVAIAIAIAVLVWLDQVALIPAIVCLIVGIHFFPLSRIFDQREYRWAAVALCVVGVLGVVALPTIDGDGSRRVVGFGAPAVLWATSVLVSRTGSVTP